MSKSFFGKIKDPVPRKVCNKRISKSEGEKYCELHQILKTGRAQCGPVLE